MNQYTPLDETDKVWPLLCVEGQWRIGLRRCFDPARDHKDNVFMWYNDALRVIEMHNLYNICYKGFSGAQHSLMMVG